MKNWITMMILLVVCSATMAQESPLNRKVSISLDQVSVKDALKTLEKESKVKLSYNPSSIAIDRKVSVEMDDVTVEAVLKRIFPEGNVGFKVSGNRIILIPANSGASSTEKATLSGYVHESGSKELLPGVTIFIPELESGTSSNAFGFYSLTVPQGQYQVLVTSIGYQNQLIPLDLTEDQTLDFDLIQATAALGEFEVKASREERVSETAQMSLVSVPIQQILDMPALAGEKDVIKTIQMLPGVQSGSEGSSRLHVRGGGPDQNLMILDDATVYNASHLFGFLSVFNTEALKSIQLYKGGFPARFGGRLSSVLDIRMRDGNKEKIQGRGSVGLLSSALTLEGPLKKGKSSFLISGRRTYLDVFLTPLLPEDSKVRYYFYDFNAKLNYDFGKRDKLYLSGYFGQDVFGANEESDSGGGFSNESKTRLNWGNATGTLRWNHLFGNKLFANTSLIFSSYKFQTREEEKTINNGSEEELFLDYSSNIRDYSLKFDLDYLPSPKISFKYGLQTTNHRFTPSALVVRDEQALDFRESQEVINTLETGVYAESTYKPKPRWNINAGLRLTHFIHKEVNKFKLEPRASLSYALSTDFSIKSSYTEMNQYVHLLTSSGLGLPTDLWVPSTDRIKPQHSKQIALGLAKDLNKQALALTVEGYYKWSSNVINYKDGASFLVLDDPRSADGVDFQDNVVAGNSDSYGVEVLLQRKQGRLSGWVGYTLAWVQLQFDSINFGRPFYAKYDRRHDLSAVLIYDLSKRIKLSANFVYGSGVRFTVPNGQGVPPSHNLVDNPFNGITTGSVDFFESRNNFRGEAYHRMDVAIQFMKQKKRWKRTWEISIYNVYNRKNAFFYITDTSERPGSPGVFENKLKRITIFPIIPSISYKFEF